VGGCKKNQAANDVWPTLYFLGAFIAALINTMALFSLDEVKAKYF
jgi:hypothetical protein